MLYDFRCAKCGSILRDVVLPIMHTKADRPTCCDEPVEVAFFTPPVVHFKDYALQGGGFRAIGIAGQPVVTSMRQHRELLKRHDMVDANDLGSPPSKQEQMVYHREKVLPSIELVGTRGLPVDGIV